MYYSATVTPEIIAFVVKAVKENGEELKRDLIKTDGCSFEEYVEICDRWIGVDEDIENEICLFEIDGFTLKEIIENENL